MPLALPLWLALLSVPPSPLTRFPNAEVARLNHAFAAACVCHLEKELSYSDDGGIIAWVRYDTPLSRYSPERRHLIETLHQARHCRDCWEALAKGDGERLRAIIGEADFAAGQMPPPAPWHRFRNLP